MQKGEWDMTLVRKTVGQIVREQAQLYPAQEAYIYPEHGIRKTYQELDAETNELAKAFIGMGIEKGEHVAIWSDNKREWLLSQYATGKMGAVLVTVNTNYQAAELEYLLKQSDATTLILDEGFKGTSYIDIIRKICPELAGNDKGNLVSGAFPHFKRVILMTEREEEGMFTWSELMAHAADVTDQQLEERFRLLEPEDVINIQYTSGTTGFPKGVMLTHNNVVNNGKLIGDFMKLTERDRVCIPVPFFHCFGCVLGHFGCSDTWFRDDIVGAIRSASRPPGGSG